jgi:isopentenyl-diphosphate delta-isomerase
MNYFDQKQFIAQVDTNDNILGRIEKWEAHKKGILHRAFTVTVFFEDQILLQHRKHPVFDSVFDATISSHQIYINDSLQIDEEAILSTLQREWNIQESDLTETPTLKGTIYYKAKDPLSEYTEHEMCRIYSCTVKELKLPNLEFAYGFSLQKIDDIKNNALYPLFAPWVTKALEEKLL